MDSKAKPPLRPPEAPFLGVGVGLRPVHYADVLARAAQGTLGVDWFEVISENFLVPGGRPPRVLGAVRSHLPVVLHGVSLDIGSTDPLNESYLDALAALARRVEPAWISDHLCWTGVDGANLHDLLPLPLRGETVRHVAARVRRVQERLGRRIALENVSSYFAWTHDAMPEWEFLAAVAEEADCGILLDVNNVYVSAHNHGFDAIRYIDAIPPERVFQLHLAGHSESGSLLIDTHDHPVRDEVWALFAHAVRRLGPVSTLIEWDDEIPPLERLEEEASRARAILEATCGASNGERQRAAAG
ncbi:MAG TPA: DUF692 domain-containing protein [Myxococcota bacterium]|nr:DUF692 domain-containing protein [Myxococcota bacterium]